MTTISVSNDVRDELLKFAAELQMKIGRKVNLNEAIRSLLAQRRARKLSPEALKEACEPLPGAEQAIEELVKERKLDEGRLERKIGA